MWPCSHTQVTSATSDVPQGSVFKQILFNVSVNNVDSGTECTFSEFVDALR